MMMYNDGKDTKICAAVHCAGMYQVGVAGTRYSVPPVQYCTGPCPATGNWYSTFLCFVLPVVIGIPGKRIYFSQAELPHFFCPAADP